VSLYLKNAMTKRSFFGDLMFHCHVTFDFRIFLIYVLGLILLFLYCVDV